MREEVFFVFKFRFFFFGVSVSHERKRRLHGWIRAVVVRSSCCLGWRVGNRLTELSRRWPVVTECRTEGSYSWISSQLDGGDVDGFGPRSTWPERYCDEATKSRSDSHSLLLDDSQAEWAYLAVGMG